MNPRELLFFLWLGLSTIPVQAESQSEAEKANAYDQYFGALMSGANSRDASAKILDPAEKKQYDGLQNDRQEPPQRIYDRERPDVLTGVADELFSLTGPDFPAGSTSPQFWKAMGEMQSWNLDYLATHAADKEYFKALAAQMAKKGRTAGRPKAKGDEGWRQNLRKRLRDLASRFRSYGPAGGAAQYPTSHSGADAQGRVINVNVSVPKAVDFQGGKP